MVIAYHRPCLRRTYKYLHLPATGRTVDDNQAQSYAVHPIPVGFGYIIPYDFGTSSIFIKSDISFVEIQQVDLHSIRFSHLLYPLFRYPWCHSHYPALYAIINFETPKYRFFLFINKKVAFVS